MDVNQAETLLAHAEAPLAYVPERAERGQPAARHVLAGMCALCASPGLGSCQADHFQNTTA